MLTPIVKKLIDERINLLNARNETLARQIQFYTQRAADYQADLTANVKELIELKSFQSTLEAVMTSSQVHDETVIEVPDNSNIPKHTNEGGESERIIRKYTVVEHEDGGAMGTHSVEELPSPPSRIIVG